MGYRRKRKRGALSKRYGRAWGAESVIRIPSRNGGVDVFLVDSRTGTPIRTIARGVSPKTAEAIIRQRHP